MDGSDSSLAALEWALEEGRLRSGQVHVVSAWHYPAIGDADGRAPDHDAFGDHTRQSHAEAMVRSAGAGVAVTGEVAEGRPADVLLGAAAAADLLVVGSRGHGGFTGMLLGSVSNHAVHHARCPMLVVRTGADSARG
ncbi:universal stress protein [Arthrobacter sp. B3I4]|uniref:universal stress protein n=1 Tax=Arthrobacter sp. B3I4 TaxID=3042267 RepID=UPI00278877E1|nr:nucleotide-binding universal stress UspA family protein [Arthrobacter sp. B3I4]